MAAEEHCPRDKVSGVGGGGGGGRPGGVWGGGGGGGGGQGVDRQRTPANANIKKPVARNISPGPRRRNWGKERGIEGEP